MVTIDAKGIYYRLLNDMIRKEVSNGTSEIHLKNVNGQYYIGDGLKGDNVKIIIDGIPGNDLGAFMDGPTIIVRNNAQDNIGNTMNNGKIVVHGHAGDVLGYGMRGGRIYIKGNVGYRVGIHMKGYKDKIPILVAGGCAGDFFGEYMAGGILVLLALRDEKRDSIVGNYLGTGMHGGVIFIRGEVNRHLCGAEVGLTHPNEEDIRLLTGIIKDYCKDLKIDFDLIMSGQFTKILPVSTRPYGNLYSY